MKKPFVDSLASSRFVSAAAEMFVSSEQISRKVSARSKQRHAWLLFVFMALILTCPVHADDDMRNWFNDPFFQLSSAIADCPVPAGPFATMAERDAQAHRRAEKGTTCWLVGECERPNAYAYDWDIAGAILSARDADAFAHTTLWATVQGRVVYIEGCAASEERVAEVEALVRNLPHVQQAFTNVRTNPPSRAPYRLRDER